MTEQTNTPASLTEDEQSLVKRSAFAAIALVSRADPGFFSMFKESMAGSRAFAAAPAGVQELLREGGFPTPPKGDAATIESTTLSELGQAASILDQKAPEQAQGYRDVILAAADQVAGASDGVAPEEQAMIDKIRTALGSTTAGAGALGGTGTLGGPETASAAEAPDLPLNDDTRPGALG